MPPISNDNLLPRPPYDPELYAAMPLFPSTPAMDPAAIAAYRAELTTMIAPVKEAILADPFVKHYTRTIPGGGSGAGAPIELHVFSPAAVDVMAGPVSGMADGGGGRSRPCIVNFHGGGFMSGDAFLGMGTMAEYVRALGAVVVSPAYRRAPEHPHPAPAEDCYAALKWVAANGKRELGVDAERRLMVAGESAGGGLAAAVALMARDDVDAGRPRLCAQLLVCPMLDDRNDSVSCRQYARGDAWDAKRNEFGWKCLLGDEAGGEGVSYYAAPTRATDLSGLPPTFIDVGSAEPFRDENVAYASKLWECGVDAELHVWPGGTHAFHTFVPTAAISEVSNQTRMEWVRRVLERVV
ncbi:esterase [Diplodia corticola]|uniref:Esterase n=1 Tax=Diplodia corticola TaxID=236234 RepID=A0A1J9R285_9PEZI|nr:esterase [Diplodia corticola]OJD35502.1 esterase [Diplodia corticola]